MQLYITGFPNRDWGSQCIICHMLKYWKLGHISFHFENLRTKEGLFFERGTGNPSKQPNKARKTKILKENRQSKTHEVHFMLANYSLECSLPGLWLNILNETPLEKTGVLFWGYIHIYMKQLLDYVWESVSTSPFLVIRFFSGLNLCRSCVSRKMKIKTTMLSPFSLKYSLNKDLHFITVKNIREKQVKS